MLLPDHLTQVIAALLLRHAVLEVVKDGQEQKYLGHDEEDDKEDLPPAVNSDMVTIFWLDIDKSVIGRWI